MATSGGLQPGSGGCVYPFYTGTGSPEGVQTGAIGETYEDCATGNIYTKVADDGLDTGWLGPVVLGTSDDFVQADVDTTINGDNTPVTLSCVLAAPPSWMDNAGNITAAGIYLVEARLAGGVAPTVPGLLVTVTGAAGFAIVPLDGLALIDLVRVPATQAYGTGDLTADTDVIVTVPTDVTATITGRVQVQRLAWNVP